ncbi:hypothetical protein GHT07_16695 [Caenimonas koreensis DSM 17982]|uniref:SEC-C motif-containing protein n=1 Tax=Caenimonas koreensis DSM 17982 TaxID=1121255 RepID=A0A844B2G4_9BURK|nr:hypothetical protein [Caenimonas koreensis DSM 17982]
MKASGRCIARVRLQSAGPGRRGLFFFGGVPCVQPRASSTNTGFEVTSKRRKGFPSETQVKRGDRVVNGRKELVEKLGRNDPCPCGSSLRFQAVLHAQRRLRRLRSRSFLSGIEEAAMLSRMRPLSPPLYGTAPDKPVAARGATLLSCRRSEYLALLSSMQ